MYERFLAVPVTGETGQDDDLRLVGVRGLADALADLDSPHARHHHIENHQVGMEGRDLEPGLDRVRGRLYLVLFVTRSALAIPSRTAYSSSTTRMRCRLATVSDCRCTMTPPSRRSPSRRPCPFPVVPRLYPEWGPTGCLRTTEAGGRTPGRFRRRRGRFNSNWCRAIANQSYTTGRPVVVADEVVYVAGLDGTIYALQE